ncbi:hypothetical protein [Streptomyces sp. NPDC056796]|uniref:hypothetical protein n=1 Tax=unclassified Streptomyces TaxID=2593676 RepID=UPI0036BC33B8
MSDARADEEPSADGPADTRPARRRPLGCLGIALLVLAVAAGGVVWLFQDELFHPFGDARACEGSEVPLSDVIGGAGSVPLPADASDVHYFTEHGRAQISFVSSRMPEFLHRSGIVPDGASPFDERYDSHYALGDGETELPKGLCGTGVRGPVLSYGGTSFTLIVERSPFTPERFRAPARAIVTYNIP